MVKIIFSDICYLESVGDYLKVHLGDKTVVTRETLSSIEAKIPSEDFIRVHRCFIVSYACIDSFTNEYIEIGKHPIPISRSYKAMVMERLEGNT